MFDLSVFQESVSKRQRDAVNAAVERAISKGTITYTDILMAAEPVQTYALEYLDGVTSESGTSSSKSNPLSFGPVRLVCLNANDSIRVARWGTRRIWGTSEPGPSEKLTTDMGNDAAVDDQYPERLARNVLRARGWPVRNKRSRGSNDGTVVEWKWLEREAKAEGAVAEVVDLYRSILARTAPEPAPTKQTKSAGAPASAHP